MPYTKRREKEPAPFSPEALDRLRRAARSIDHEHFVLIEAFYRTGARISEL